MLRSLLIKLCFLVWGGLVSKHNPQVETPDARSIAEAAVDSVLEDVARGIPPVGPTYYHDLSTQVYWAFRESNLLRRAVGDGGSSHGPWQLQGECGFKPLGDQARCWRAIVHDGQRLCPDAPYAILWGGCNIDLAPYGLAGWTTRSASLQRVRKSESLLRAALDRLVVDDPE